MIRPFEDLGDLRLAGIGRGLRRRDVRAPAVRLGRISFRQRTLSKRHKNNHQEHEQQCEQSSHPLAAYALLDGLPIHVQVPFLPSGSPQQTRQLTPKPKPLV